MTSRFTAQLGTSEGTRQLGDLLPMNSRWKDRLARDQMSLLASPACGPPLGPTATLELTPEPAQWGRRGPQSRHTVEEGRPPGDASRRVRDPSRQPSRPFPALGPETLRSLPTSRTQPRRQPDGRPHAHTAANRPRLSYVSLELVRSLPARLQTRTWCLPAPEFMVALRLCI